MTVETLNSHLKTGATHVCTCWAVTRSDGIVLGFTDHDRLLSFEGVTFTPDSGLSAKAISSTTGLAVNNTEALGMINADAITDADIEAGRFDGAEVVMWQVRWDEVADREIRFRGSIGEIVRESGTYRVELRGLTEMLNQPQGRAYLRCCSAVLGDARCRVDVDSVDFRADALIEQVTNGQVYHFSLTATYTDRWFEGGMMRIRSGDAGGLTAAIKRDEIVEGQRVITLWRPLPSPIAVGDQVSLVAGCDKRAESCRVKFDNLVNFQGFPDIPGDDWLMSVPRSDGDNSGGSLLR